MLLKTQPLDDVMSHLVATTTAQTTVMDALNFAQQHQIHHLPVFSGEALVGMVCTCDLYDARLQATVEEVMKAPVVALDKKQTALEAAELMRERAVGSVVVLSDSRPCGIVTRGDLLQHWPDIESTLGPSRCECCGLTRHLETDVHGRTLCMYCDERAHDESWFELGGSD